MKFKEGDKVQFIREGSLIDGVVKEFKDCSPDMWYLIDEGCKGCKDSWIFGGHLIPLSPLPVIPQFVADAIDTFKDEGDSLAVAIDYEVYTEALIKELSLDIKMRGWLWETSNQELFARAWMGGYEVEKEPLYYVRFFDGEVGFLQVYLNGVRLVGWRNKSEEYKVKFTESEIKEMNEKYWAFKVPVEDLEKNK
ncbi:DUF1642 domain-containing protein [Listeria monocytogenes]|uniref:DUF1642 domain-containing protein n=1 Tax=Listeria monocytogenes TaxID=1639 RepID=UPI00190DDC82|nr:DUF1642 domain-containing protein [Listeria monocytogenes]MBK3695733.1 DUF1642 domain-containing protein [Listeria monocytogenes]